MATVIGTSTTPSDDIALHIPCFKGVSFEITFIERYGRRESIVEEASVEMHLAGVSVRRVTSGFSKASADIAARLRDPLFALYGPHLVSMRRWKRPPVLSRTPRNRPHRKRKFIVPTPAPTNIRTHPDIVLGWICAVASAPRACVQKWAGTRKTSRRHFYCDYRRRMGGRVTARGLPAAFGDCPHLSPAVCMAAKRAQKSITSAAGPRARDDRGPRACCVCF